MEVPAATGRVGSWIRRAVVAAAGALRPAGGKDLVWLSLGTCRI